MRPHLPLLLTLLSVGALAWSAHADEIVSTGVTGAPPAAEAPPPRIGPDAEAQATGAWARGILAGEPAAQDAKPSRAGCEPVADRKPHGEVWAGIGTGGYREAGGVVTQPVGACGQVTIAIDRTEGGGWRRR